jgi:hypothetical protein
MKKINYIKFEDNKFFGYLNDKFKNINFCDLEWKTSSLEGCFDQYIIKSGGLYKFQSYTFDESGKIIIFSEKKKLHHSIQSTVITYTSFVFQNKAIYLSVEMLIGKGQIFAFRVLETIDCGKVKVSKTDISEHCVKYKNSFLYRFLFNLKNLFTFYKNTK